MSEGIYLRHYLGQEPGKTGPNWTASPDIIPNNTQPADVPWLKSQTGYDTEPPTKITPQVPNYVYLRGKNITTTEVTSRMWLYYAESNVVQWPQSWGYTDIQTTQIVDGNLVGLNYTYVKAQPNQIVVTDPPFLWTPPPFSGGDHYCLVGFVENPPVSIEPVPPLPGAFGSWDELAQFVIKNPYMAWRNTIAVRSDVPEWKVQAPIAGAKEGGQFNVGFQCKDMPADGELEITVPGPDSDNTVNIKRQTIPRSGWGLTISVEWPKGYNSYMNISFWKGKQSIKTGANVQPVVGYPMNLLAARMPELAYGEKARAYRQPVEMVAFDSVKMDSSATIQIQILGSIPYQFTSTSPTSVEQP